MGSIFPEDLGGAGLGYIDYSIIVEELARIDPSVALIVAAHTSLCTNHIYSSGSPRTAAPLRPATGYGRSGSAAGRSPSPRPARTPPARAPRPCASRDYWVLNGAKTFTTNAHEADVCVAMAVTDRTAAQHGISAFILETDTPGSASAARKTSSACAPVPPAK